MKLSREQGNLLYAMTRWFEQNPQHQSDLLAWQAPFPKESEDSYNGVPVNNGVEHMLDRIGENTDNSNVSDLNDVSYP